MVAATLCGGLDASAQKHVVSGTVLDGGSGTSVPLVGATVTIKGTSLGTNTDIYGRYSLTVNSPEDILEFQFIGYETQEIKVGAQTAIDVVLKDSSQKIGEVVVTALGITREEALAHATNPDMLARKLV